MKMGIRIPLRLRSLLNGVLKERYPSLQDKLQPDGTLNINPQEALELQQALGDELCDTGLKSDDEPNARGHDIETLIDLIGRVAQNR